MIITPSAAGGGKLPSELLLYGNYLYLKIGFLVVIVNLSSLDERGGKWSEINFFYLLQCNHRYPGDVCIAAIFT